LAILLNQTQRPIAPASSPSFQSERCFLAIKKMPSAMAETTRCFQPWLKPQDAFSLG
jgi:hypothetical protein